MQIPRPAQMVFERVRVEGFILGHEEMYSEVTEKVQADARRRALEWLLARRGLAFTKSHSKRLHLVTDVGQLDYMIDRAFHVKVPGVLFWLCRQRCE